MSGYLYKPAADYLLKNNLKNTLYYLFIMVLMGVLSVVFEAIVQTMYSKQVQEYIGSLRQKIVAHFYAQGGKSVAEMQNDLSNNLDMLTDNCATPLQTIIGNSFSLIMIIGVLFQLNWSLLVLTVVLAVINLLTPKIMEKAANKANEQISIENSKLLKAIDYWMGGMGMILGNVMTYALSRIDKKWVTQGNAILSTVQQFAGAVGTSVTSAIVAVSQNAFHSKAGMPTAIGTQHAFIFLLIVAIIIWALFFKYVKDKH